MNKYQPVLDYIHDYWDRCLVASGKTDYGNARNIFLHIGRIKLPHPSVAPNHLYFAGSQYYWDSYFTVIGLIESGRIKEAKWMVDNLVYLFRIFDLIPARNSYTSIGRTQPPFLTSMAWEVYEAGGASDIWMNKVMDIARQEYEDVWTNSQREVEGELVSRYQPRYLRKMLTVYESGWDVSSRFALGRTELLPVDLNCLLYKYEKDLAKWAKHRKDGKSLKLWVQRGMERKQIIDEYFWDEAAGFYYDYDLKEGKRDKLVTLAGFYPLWAGVASQEQAERCMKHLKSLEFKWGLANTEKVTWQHRQWDYPNGWPPQQLLAVEGLLNYGHEKEAKRIAIKYLEVNLKQFNDTGELWEKYDVVQGAVGKRGRYPTQPGFSWTNAVFLRLYKRLRSL